MQTTSDHKTDIRVVCYGETLWDMLPTGAVAGGAPMNVAVHLRMQGVYTQMISAVGNDSTGRELLEYMRDKGLDTNLVQSVDHPTGVVEVDVSDPTSVQYDITQGVAWDYIPALDPMKEVVQSANALVYGSLIMRNKVSRDTLLSLLRGAKLKCLDVNLRSPFYNKNTIETLLTHSDIVKMNEEEIAIIDRWWYSPADTMVESMRRLKDKFNLKVVLVSRGAEGACAYTDDGYYEHPGYSVQVVDTIGSGDSFLAAILRKYTQGGSMAESLAYGCAVGAWVAQHAGANPPINEEAVRDIMKSI